MASPTPPTKVVIVGAGWGGLVAAKTYLQVSRRLSRPVDLKILDSNASVGGAWSSDRVYPGLLAQSPVGIFEYSDLTL